MDRPYLEARDLGARNLMVQEVREAQEAAILSVPLEAVYRSLAEVWAAWVFRERVQLPSQH